MVAKKEVAVAFARVRLLVNELMPEKVLLLIKRVDDAEETVTDPPSETLWPLTVIEELARSELPILVEATSLLLASVVTIELPVMFGVQIVPNVASEVEAFATLMSEKVVDAEKMLLPKNVLLFARSVEEAAVIVFESPRLKVVPFTVTLEFANWLLPIVLVETNRVPSKARSVPFENDVAFDPPFAIESAEPSESVPRDAD